MQAGFFEAKTVPLRSVLDLAAAFVMYIILGNISLRLNPVGFYQVTKILVAPTVLCCEAISSRTLPSARVLASVAMLSGGIALATVTDSQVCTGRCGCVCSLHTLTHPPLPAGHVQHARRGDRSSIRALNGPVQHLGVV